MWHSLWSLPLLRHSEDHNGQHFSSLLFKFNTVILTPSENTHPNQVEILPFISKTIMQSLFCCCYNAKRLPIKCILKDCRWWLAALLWVVYFPLCLLDSLQGILCLFLLSLLIDIHLKNVVLTYFPLASISPKAAAAHCLSVVCSNRRNAHMSKNTPPLRPPTSLWTKRMWSCLVSQERLQVSASL